MKRFALLLLTLCMLTTSVLTVGCGGDGAVTTKPISEGGNNGDSDAE